MVLFYVLPVYDMFCRLFDIAKQYGKVGMLPVNVLFKKSCMKEYVDNYTTIQWQYYIIIVCLLNRMRTLFNDYVKEENDSGQVRYLFS
jgi:hypothetical protein